MADMNRIEQLRKAVESDPNDELAQFSLGNALVDAEMFGEAGPCFQRVLAVNSQNSKAYEMLSRVQNATGHRDLAVQTALNGYRVAQRRGDMLPMKAMAAMLSEWGTPAPVAAGPSESAARTTVGSGAFSCKRCGGAGPQLEKAPFKGALGQTILETICGSCWREWIGQGTKVINELRLPMYDPHAQEVYDRHMKEFLMIE